MIRAFAARAREWLHAHRRRLVVVTASAVLLYGIVGCWHQVKPLPPDLVFSPKPTPVDRTDIRFLSDISHLSANGESVREQEIFDEIHQLIDGARRLVVLDLFLLNDHLGLDTGAYRPLSSELVEALVNARRRTPQMPIVLVTDPINDLYGGDPSPQLQALRNAGVQVVVTDLLPLRDSNPLYSSFWRLFIRWWGNSPNGGYLPNPLDPSGRKVTLRTYLRLGNFKANHRKAVLADDGGRWVTIVTSANPHDASSAHSNVGVRIAGAGLARQVYTAEMEVVRMSGGAPPFASLPDLGAAQPVGDHRVAYLTESAIRDKVLELIDGCGPGDEIDLALFYLSHQRIIAALRDAAARGVWVRAVLDPNRDAFGHEKPGIPNRQAAEYLHRTAGGAVAMRWYATHGEQFHSKLIVVRRPQTVDVVLGSANFTRRNLDDYNLEASVWI
ncbi:MAG: phospholipase D-like domain-containing protein, partial [Thermoanaerobaculales bacterium]|nr:phospholipase D-like domain-containing protein [Thermoanaerobaculales bacterium]